MAPLCLSPGGGAYEYVFAYCSATACSSPVAPEEAVCARPDTCVSRDLYLLPHMSSPRGRWDVGCVCVCVCVCMRAPSPVAPWRRARLARLEPRLEVSDARHSLDPVVQLILLCKNKNVFVMNTGASPRAT